ncbi:MAG: hypothetical protein AAGA30_17735 [Planctomycetota bacterium]
MNEFERSIVEFSKKYAIEEFNRFSSVEFSKLEKLGSEHEDYSETENRYIVTVLMIRSPEYIEEQVKQFSPGSHENVRIFLDHPETLFVLANEKNVLDSRWQEEFF